MKPYLHFDFSVDKEQNSILVTRQFAAKLPLVWDAWTKPEILDQWWAPKPYRTKTISMDFREGGRWFYGMISPANETHWCVADYEKINPKNFFTLLDGFCDDAGNLTTQFPRSHWTNVFSEAENKTTVSITIRYQSLADLETIIKLGFKEGFTMAMGNLDELLESKTIHNSIN